MERVRGLEGHGQPRGYTRLRKGIQDGRGTRGALEKKLACFVIAIK
jgi:hypothetical protein